MATALQIPENMRLAYILARKAELNIEEDKVIIDATKADPGQVSRMLSGKQPVSPAFIKKFVNAFPDGNLSAWLTKIDIGELPKGKRVITLDDYYAKIEGEVEFLRSFLKSEVSTLLSNSNKLIEGQEAILASFVNGRSGALEKDAETDKAYEEGKEIAVKLKDRQKGKRMGKSGRVP